MHPRSRHAGRYDFAALTRVSPELSAVASLNPSGEPTIDFADPAAVLALNGALLKAYYGVTSWQLPPGYLCPPVPGRADYVHTAADLIGMARGAAVRVLDIGVGANCVYPIIGRAEYGWRFTGSDTDPVALANAQRIVEANACLSGGVELRLQTNSSSFFEGVVNAGESYELSMCNPPFHASREEAENASRTKWAKLGRRPAAERNFGGASGELWYPGGEETFVRRMVEESPDFGKQVKWFTCLISKAASLPAVEKALSKANVVERRTIDMAQGQKKSRLVAWSFHP